MTPRTNPRNSAEIGRNPPRASARFKVVDRLRPDAVVPMHAKTVLTLALVALVATAGVAVAQPAGGPSDAPPEDDRQGPPDDLPGPVPDFVGDILDTIQQHLSGALSGEELGESLADLLGGNQSASDGARQG